MPSTSRLRLLRVAGVALGLSLMIGELWRSWGVERPLAFVLDDQLMGGFLVVSAWLCQPDTWRRRATFASAWGMNAGMLYGSFFGKLLAPETSEPGNWDLGVLTLLVGVAFFASLSGLVASLVMSRHASGDAQ